ncbi:PA14 domain-containing protein [Streptomyces sp. NPDC049555]|uniref:PA14 domain-containing protein n=1 Tax=Streptomyces sp. NPDC049555 TaxID=3154930 RepID=UPI0034128F61
MATAVTAALSGTLLGAQAPGAARAPAGAPSKVALPRTAPGGPTAPAWPEGTFDAAPAAAGGGPAAPAPAGPADAATLTDPRPELAAAPQQGAVAYEFVLGAGETPRSGQVTSSGWLPAPRWRIPAGLLKDGATYRWTVRAKDRSGRAGTDAPARTFTVNERLGAAAPGGPVATDTLGPVTVGLATGNVSMSVATPQVATGSGPLGATFTYNSQAAAASAGLTGSYYAGDADGGIGAHEKPAARRTDARADFRWDAERAPYDGAQAGAAFRARWSGTLRVPADGRFRLGGTYDGGVRILIDGKAVLDDWAGKGAGDKVAYGRTVTLRAGHAYDLTVEYRHRAGGGHAALWATAAGHSAPVPASWLQPSAAILPPGWTVTPPPGSASGGSGAAALPGGFAAAAGATPGAAAAAVIGAAIGAGGPAGGSPGTGQPGGSAAGLGTAALPGAAAGAGAPQPGAAALGFGIAAPTAGAAAPVGSAARAGRPAAGRVTDASAGAAASAGRSGSGTAAGTGAAAGRTAGASPQALGADSGGVVFHFAGERECAPGSGAPAGYLCAVSVPGAGDTHLFYRDGKLVRIVNPGDETTDLGFSADHRLTSVRPSLVMDWIAVDRGRRDTDAAAYRIEYAAGSAAATSLTGPDPEGVSGRADRRPHHAYRYAGGTAEVAVAGATGPQGWSRKVTQDAAGRVAADTDATGRTTRFAWTAADQPSWREDAAGRLTTTVYNEAGMPAGAYGPGPRRCFGEDLRPLSPAPEGCAKVPAQTTALDPAGMTTERADSDGVPRLVTQTRLDQTGMPAALVTDPEGLALTTRYESEASGRPVAEIAPDGTRKSFAYYGAGESVDNPCTKQDDPAPQRGLPKSITLPASATGSARVEKFVYGSRGLPVAVNFAGPDWTCVQYDARGRISRMSMPGNPSLPAWTVTYDSASGGDPLTVKAVQHDHFMTNTVDLLGRAVRYTDGVGTRTETTYDRAGRMVRQRVTPPGDGDAAQVEEVRRDAAGRTLAVALDGRTLATAEYDAAGQVHRVRYGNGSALGVERDEAGRITGKNWTLADGTALPARVTRSQSGTVVAESVPGAEPSAFRYDAAGRLVHARIAGHEYDRDFTSPAPAECPKGTRANAGTNGNVVRTTERTAKGTTVTGYCYDDADRLLATTGENPLTGTTYALNGHLTGYTAAGTRQTQRQDAAERYLGAGVTGPGAADVVYTKDIADHVMARTATTAKGTDRQLYGHTDMARTAPDLVLGADKRLLTRVVELPGGVLLSARPAAARGAGRTTWSYPTVHGDVFLTAGDDGRRTGDVYRYGLYGEPLRPDGSTDPQHVPDNLPGDFDYGWLGRYQVGTEHQGALYNVVLDTRVLNPSFGRFSAPIAAGPFLNPYEYAAGDPVNHTSINGYSLDVEQE